MDFLDRLDPDVAAAVRVVPIRDLRNIPAARQAMLAMLAMFAAADDAATVSTEDHVVPGLGGAPDVRLRRYRPTDASGALPCLYWIHGGGYVMGRVEQDDAYLQQIVAAVGCAVVSVDWRLAPENPYPAALDDCYAGLRWTAANAAPLGIDPERIAVGGGSSGGGSAAALALLARDRAEVALCYQLLIYPMIDDRNETPSSRAITDARVWNRESNLIAWRAYLGDWYGTSDVPVYAAASRATNLADLPPAFVAVGELDLLLDEDVQYAQRLLQARVRTDLHVYAGAHHAFDRVAPTSGVAQRFVRDRDDALRRAFQR